MKYYSLDIPMGLYNKLLDMALEVKTQDNHMTQKPIVHEIHRPVAHYARDDESGNAEMVIYYDTSFYTFEEWVERSDSPELYENLDGEEFFEVAKEEARYDAELFYRWYENERYEPCGTFLTRKAAQSFIDSNQHHVGGKAFIYVNHAWRNKDAELIQRLMEYFADETVTWDEEDD